MLVDELITGIVTRKLEFSIGIHCRAQFWRGVPESFEIHSLITIARITFHRLTNAQIFNRDCDAWVNNGIQRHSTGDWVGVGDIHEFCRLDASIVVKVLPEKLGTAILSDPQLMQIWVKRRPEFDSTSSRQTLNVRKVVLIVSAARMKTTEWRHIARYSRG